MKFSTFRLRAILVPVEIPIFRQGIGIATALVLTSQQAVDAWIGYMPALVPAVPTMLKLFVSARDPNSMADNA